MELFNKQVSDQDQNVEELDYLAEQEAMNAADTSNFSSNNMMNMINGENKEVMKPLILSYNGNDRQKDHINHFNPSISRLENLNFPYASSMQFNFSEENRAKDVFWPENVKESSFVSEEHQGNDNNCVKQENGRSDSMSNCSDQFDDEDDDSGKYRSRASSGKGPPAKNLAAERRRRKKLNDRLYTLRALVPKISKLDKASILVDAISYVEELKTQVKELQEELEERSEEDQGSIKPEKHCSNESQMGAKQNKYPQLSNDKGPQMEIQVQVTQIDAKEFFVKVFCEQKQGGFVKLLEALDSLGLEVTNANVTSFRGLVSNVLKVEKKDSEIVQADYVRESLLELTRDPPNNYGYVNDSNHHLFHHIHD